MRRTLSHSGLGFAVPDRASFACTSWANAYVMPDGRELHGEESLADLKRQVSAMIEATVQSVNTRPSHSRKRV